MRSQLAAICSRTLVCMIIISTALVTANTGAAAAVPCVNAGSDSDGDGWGWENNRSCVMPAKPAPTTDTGTSPQPNSTPICTNANSDPDSDGWGWENNRSCVMPTRPGPVIPLPLPIPTAVPFAQTCATMASFVAGCNVSSGAWTSAFAAFAAETNIAAPGQDVGARVQVVENPGATEQVLYVVGPYLAATGEADDIDSIIAETQQVWAGAPAVGDVVADVANDGVAVVYIGFGDAPDSQLPVASRVRAVKAAIRAFENLRTNSASPRNEAMLIGISLGGVAGKIALSELEAERFDHGVDTYMSFDSPHFGAYVPYSVQYVPVFMEAGFEWLDRKIWGSSREARDAALTAGAAIDRTLRNPVAQDLLVANLGYEDQRSPNINYVRSRARALPSSTYNVAVASGAIDGTRPGLRNDILTVNTGKSGRNTLKSLFVMNTTVPQIGQDSVVATGRVSFLAPLSGWKINKRIGYSGTFTVTSASGAADWHDRAPCAHSTEILDEIDAELTSSLGSFWSNPLVDVDEDRSCFIPTYSAIIGASDAAGNLITGATSFDQVIGNSNNDAHLRTSGTMDAEVRSVANATFAGSLSSSSRQAKRAVGYTPSLGEAVKASPLFESVEYEFEDGSPVSDAMLDSLGLGD